MQHDCACSTRTHAAVTHGGVLLMYAPQRHIHAYSLTAGTTATPMLPRSRVGMPVRDEAGGAAALANSEQEAGPPSAVWRAADLVPGATDVEQATLTRKTCRVMDFEGASPLLARLRSHPDAGSRYTALAVDEPRGRCATRAKACMPRPLA